MDINEILKESVSGGFWKFIGYYLIIASILWIPAKVIIYTMRHHTMRRIGYPPIHCDADGDFKEEEK